MKKLMIVVIASAILFSLAYWYFFADMDRLPKGELMASYSSPSGEYTVNAYLVSGNATSRYAVRCEVVTAKKVCNIYWQYDEDEAACEWLSDDVISINGHDLNVLTDKYDWRHQ